MSGSSTDLVQLLRTMEPELHEGVYVFASVPHGTQGLDPLATFREAEGLTVVVEEAAAAKLGLKVLFRAAWLTLKVHSDLQAVGFTAAFAKALGEAGISCNVFAGAHHDHVFVPAEGAQEALEALRALQQAGGG
jgi:hypothetical protein